MGAGRGKTRRASSSLEDSGAFLYKLDKEFQLEESLELKVGMDGTRSWYNEYGLLHRDGGPAREHPDGRKEWYQNGTLHREDGPALVGANGKEEWHYHGYYHRVGGPAVKHANGSKDWWQQGKLHREDGPAVEHPDGRREWWLRGKKMSEKEFLRAQTLENLSEAKLEAPEKTTF
jgi:hypothetical protein